MPVSTIPIPKQNTRFAGSFKTQNIPISSLQGQQLRSGQSPTSVLGADVAPSVVPPLAKVTTSSTKTTATPPPTPSNFSLALKAAGGTLDAPFKTEQLDPSGLNRSTGQYMYGGPLPQLVSLPWKGPTNVGPIVPLPATTQPPPATITIGAKRENIPITPEQGQRLRAGEDPSVVLGQSPTPAAPTPVHRTEDIPITPEQGQRLRAGEDPGTVLGSGILPQSPAGTPLPPAMTPESIGPPTVTPLGQLNNPPWTPLATAIIPDNMGHVVTDPQLMELLKPQVPKNSWESHTLRVGWEKTGVVSNSPPLQMQQPIPEFEVPGTVTVVPRESSIPTVIRDYADGSDVRIDEYDFPAGDARDQFMKDRADALSGGFGSVDLERFLRKYGFDPLLNIRITDVDAFLPAKINEPAKEDPVNWVTAVKDTIEKFVNTIEDFSVILQQARNAKPGTGYWNFFVMRFAIDPHTGMMVSLPVNYVEAVANMQPGDPWPDPGPQPGDPVPEFDSIDDIPFDFGRSGSQQNNF